MYNFTSHLGIREESTIGTLEHAKGNFTDFVDTARDAVVVWLGTVL